jgi:TonB-dependent SusC/RagA subfamily outer membrane receptor
MKRSILQIAAMSTIKLVSILFLYTASAHAYSISKDGGITIHKKNASLVEIMSLIERKTEYSFWYRKDIATKAKKITISVKDATINQVLDLCAEGQPFTFQMVDKIIALKPDTAFSKILLTTSAAIAGGKERAKGKIVTDGYQQVDEKLSTSSITKVEGNNLNQTNTGNILGNASINGLQIQTDAKGNTSMLIQGKNSISSGTQPLILLDNMPYQGDISQINAANVESVNILKDASATSIYGSRGANGVIIITTKKAAVPAIDPLESLITERDGIDYYEGAHAYAIFKHIAKRYNVEVSYKSAIPVGFYHGKIPAFFSLEQMLSILTASGIVFQREKVNDAFKERIIVN